MTSPPTQLPSPIEQAEPKPVPSTPTRKRQKRKNDFNIGKVIGRGAFGEVLKVQDIETGKYYAMKVLSKSRISREKKINYVILERDAMNALNHPNIIRLYLTFQDNSNLYYVVELADNGDLQHVLNQYVSLDIPIAKQILGQILLALAHMHQCRIIHRDIKPENILLDRNNSVKITDFGTAKMYKRDEPFYSQHGSFVGSPDYVSPETLNETPISAATDLWSFGCLVYQFFTGYAPFHTSSNYETFQKIESGKYTISDFVPADAKDLITKLLKLNPEERIGYNDFDNGYETIKSHPFFSGINWEELPRMKLDGFRSFEPAVQAMKENQQKDSTKKLFSDSEIVIKEGMVVFESKQRMLVLLEPPKLLICNIDLTQIKKNIPLSNIASVSIQGNELVLVNGLTNAKYEITCDSDDIQLWLSAIKESISSK